MTTLIAIAGLLLAGIALVSSLNLDSAVKRFDENLGHLKNRVKDLEEYRE